MTLSRIIAFALLAYSLSVAVGIESMNSLEEGGILQNWHLSQREEFPDRCCGSGVGKMRRQDDFQGFLFVFGILVYPACVFSACVFITQARKANQKTKMRLFAFCSALCLIILARFFWLGVFSAAVGIG